jgi:hypothetical protein
VTPNDPSPARAGRALRRGLLGAPLAVAAAAAVTLAAGAGGRGATIMLGASTPASEPTFQGYYDGHKDTYLATDVSSKSQAAALKINDAPPLIGVAGQPPMYFVQGRAARGQLAVFGSEPGESDYSPLWTEVLVTWKAGQTPTLLVRDDQVTALAKRGKLTATTTKIILNAPIIRVGKGG